jgi:serine/threonine protein kinase
LIQQGQTCAVYQGFDQVLQRAVAIKVASAEYAQVYRAAIRSTAQFAHPNIIGIYDLIIEPDTLYIVQEYVDGDDFGTLLQSQLSPYHVVDFGVQICQALMYAGTPARKVCHGDLTPAALIRDRRGSVRVNNFALPSDTNYFMSWSIIGGNPATLADPELPVGQASDGRRADDTRAVGLLLYQLLAGRSADARVVEPSHDGRLRFMRNAPPEVCELIARALVRQHPQYISTPEALHAELKVLAEALEPPAPVVAPAATAYQMTEDVMSGPSQFSPVRTGQLISQPLMQEGTRGGLDYAPRVGAGAEATMMAMDKNGGQPVADFPRTTSQQLGLPPGQYSGTGLLQEKSPRVNMPLIIVLGLVLFALFFGLGYYLSTILIK